ncbi:MAG: diphthamide biosynthesis enzyme Dph2 [Candidatus Thermoplasmatota archaeon]|nr:diphthamide biosynthesis enzyme Dph2 [Candidatus Thermoplasmatota archaeon]
MAERIFPSFDLEIDGILKVITSSRYQIILLQVPEGMKRGAIELAEHIERETEARVLIDGELCYGACDHAGTRAKLLGLDAVIHLGHSDIPSMKSECSVPVHFFPTSMKIDTELLLKGLQDVLRRIVGKRFGLTTTVQHLGLLDTVKEELNKHGKVGVVGAPGKREEFEGQVLGCSFQSPRTISDDVDAFIYIGTGRFHPIGMVNAVKKPVWTVDPMTGDITKYTKRDLDNFLRKRWGAISSSKEKIDAGARIGIILGTKPGQMRKKLAEDALRACDQGGADCSMIVMDHIDPMKLRSIGIEIAVITACPRIAYDDISRYTAEKVIVITSNELMIALGREEWDDYSFDEDW